MTEKQTPQKQPFCGFLNVLKPPGMTSAQVVGKVRYLLSGAKVGHAGTLDPEAAGVLPLMIGKAARLFDYMQDKEKAYIAEVAFGAATDTQDAQGLVTDTGDHYPDEATLRAALPRFMGNLQQTPPMFSALKRDGKRLYDLARHGETVKLAARPVTVHALTLLGMTQRHGALLAVRCSKGFYVRTLCHDLGAAVGCPAHMRFLLRTQSGVFTLATARTLEELRLAAGKGTLETLLLPMETALQHLPTAEVPPELAKPFRNGIPLPAERLWPSDLPQEQPVRLYLQGELTAIGVRSGNTVTQKTWLANG
ncbi:MAG: tRNA pseudouridine(55) synthase TruB [Eubacteriales bacterium]|nr:tRNA pseudouridine(55) synthase TruB [Eubacteriales bacterium]